MKSNEIRTAVCPLCGRVYHEHPALSRTDNETLMLFKHQSESLLLCQLFNLRCNPCPQVWIFDLGYQFI